MLFNTFNFIVFFVTVCVLYFLCPQRAKWVVLLAASYIFYMAWQPELITLIVFSTFLNYVSAALIYRCKKNDPKRKLYLIICLVINFGLLFVFKYFMFFRDGVLALFTENYPFKDVSIILPMGISFYTFQAAAYTIDVYRGDIKPIKNYGKFSLFISFFPQLVAGPIERSKNLIPQFYKKHYFDIERVIYGVKIMLYGLFKKMVIADRAAIAVNTIYNSPQSYGGFYFVMAAFLFSFQIYCDFSGYSDIALGAAKVLGFDLMENFRNPCLSKSIKEFWRRWHISLSTWFMDYIYIPLGGSRVSRGRTYFNLVTTFAVSGLWHGANWTFVIWGLVHGVMLVIGSMTNNIRTKIKKSLHIENNILMNIISISITFWLVALALVFFRANTARDALYILKSIFSGFPTTRQYLYEVLCGMGISLYEIIALFSAIAFIVIIEIFSGNEQVYNFIEKRNLAIRTTFYFIITVSILSLGVYYNAGEFIYFQF